MRTHRVAIAEAVSKIWPFALIFCVALAGQTVERLPDPHPKSRVDPGLAYSIPANSHNQIHLPRITRFPDGAVLKAVNDDLRTEELKLRTQRTDCFAGSTRELVWEQTSRVAVFTRDILSIENEAFVYCGGNHPDEDYEPLTYNMRTGKQFDFDRDSAEIFNAGELPVNDLIDLYKQHYPSSAGDCKASMIEPDTQLYLHFEAAGLAILPDLPHVVAACGPEITVPYRELKPLLNTSNPFQALIGP